MQIMHNCFSWKLNSFLKWFTFYGRKIATLLIICKKTPPWFSAQSPCQPPSVELQYMHWTIHFLAKNYSLIMCCTLYKLEESQPEWISSYQISAFRQQYARIPFTEKLNKYIKTHTTSSHSIKPHRFIY